MIYTLIVIGELLIGNLSRVDHEALYPKSLGFEENIYLLIYMAKISTCHFAILEVKKLRRSGRIYKSGAEK